MKEKKYCYKKRAAQYCVHRTQTIARSLFNVHIRKSLRTSGNCRNFDAALQPCIPVKSRGKFITPKNRFPGAFVKYRPTMATKVTPLTDQVTQGPQDAHAAGTYVVRPETNRVGKRG